SRCTSGWSAAASPGRPTGGASGRHDGRVPPPRGRFEVSRGRLCGHSPRMGTPAFQAYAISAALLAVQLILLAFWTGAMRGRSKQYVLPEDKIVLKGELSEQEH